MSIHKFAKDLVKEGLITEDQLILAKASEENLGIELGHILIARGFITEEKLLNFLSSKLQLAFHDPQDSEVDGDTLRALPFHLAKKNGVLPLHKDEEGKAVVVMADPQNGAALEDLRSYFPGGFRTLLGSPQKIIQMLEKHHQKTNTFEQARVTLEITSTDDEVQAEIETKKIHEIASGPKVIAAVNNIIVGAKKDGASDIHLEPYRDGMRVRYRVDGLLQEKGTLPKAMHMPIVSRIKIMGNLNIAERRVPQDGRARVMLFGQPLDLRISTCPTQFGEKVVMRVLSKDNVKTIEALGFNDRDSRLFIDIISKANGIFLVTGPTGSGKSSTLYAGLMRINSPEVNIITIEDPVESEIDGVNQVAVNPKQGLTFAGVLRSALRQDPDVIMIGEIRDGETAEIAVRAAITGHMVISTLHTNSAPGAVDRLKDMGIEPFMMASSLKGVLAQRLVRKICENCRQEVPTENAYNIPLKKAFKGAGCDECHGSGCTGRIGIFEMLDINREVRKLIHNNAGEDDLKRYMEEKGIFTMLQDGIDKVERGITTIDEVLRVTMED